MIYDMYIGNLLVQQIIHNIAEPFHTNCQLIFKNWSLSRTLITITWLLKSFQSLKHLIAVMYILPQSFANLICSKKASDDSEDYFKSYIRIDQKCSRCIFRAAVKDFSLQARMGLWCRWLFMGMYKSPSFSLSSIVQVKGICHTKIFFSFGLMNNV